MSSARPWCSGRWSSGHSGGPAPLVAAAAQPSTTNLRRWPLHAACRHVRSCLRRARARGRPGRAAHGAAAVRAAALLGRRARRPGTGLPRAALRRRLPLPLPAAAGLSATGVPARRLPPSGLPVRLPAASRPAGRARVAPQQAGHGSLLSRQGTGRSSAGANSAAAAPHHWPYTRPAALSRPAQPRPPPRRPTRSPAAPAQWRCSPWPSPRPRPRRRLQPPAPTRPLGARHRPPGLLRRPRAQLPAGARRAAGAGRAARCPATRPREAQGPRSRRCPSTDAHVCRAACWAQGCRLGRSGADLGWVTRRARRGSRV